jgi:hypothetical protein
MATDASALTGDSHGEASSPPQFPRRQWAMAGTAIVVLAAVATVALHWLTRGIWTWVLAVPLAILWLVGAAMLVSALWNRPGYVTISVSRVVRASSAIVWLAIGFAWGIIARVVNLLGGIGGGLDTAVGRARVTLPTKLPDEWRRQIKADFQDELAQAARKQRGPLWKRAVKGLALMVAGAMVSWAIGYYLPARPVATTNVTTPPSTSTTQSHAPHT